MAMNISISVNSGYQIITVEDELNIISELSELRFLIEGYISDGKNSIAVRFTNASYIYSGAIAVLIDCYKKIKNVGGDLCIIEGNPQIIDIFRMLNIDRVIHIYKSVEELQTATQA
jgi:anti-sigma B factor antagonist